jgi:hypothetical protein
MSERFTGETFARLEAFVCGASTQLTCSAEVSLVRTSATLESAPASMASAQDSGPSLPDSLASYDHATSSWRTSQHCLLGGLDEFSETWPRAGMTRNGTAYPLRPSVPLTGVIASGLWPTPNLPSGGRTLPDGTTRTGMTPDGRKKQVDLNQAVKRWPTPRSTDWKANGYQQKGDNAWPTLVGAVRMWPTPTAVTDTGGAAMCKWGGSGARAKLRTMTTAAELNGALNPTWVEWLMGYPLEWTACEAWVTRSSRKSRNGSDSKS